MWSAVAAIVLTGGRFFVTMLLARKLGVTEFGKFAFAQWLVDILFLTLAFGLPGSASRFFAEFRTRYANLVAYERWYLPRALVVIAVVALTSPLFALALNGTVGYKFALLQAGWTASTAAWALLMARAQGLQRFRRVAVSNFVFVMVALAGCAWLPDQGTNVEDAVLLVTIATTAAAFVTWLPLPGSINAHEPLSSKSDLNHRALRTFGLNIWITSLLGSIVWSRGEIVIVQAQLGFSDVAIYSIALSLTSIATQGLMLLTGALAPHLTQIWGEGKQEVAIQQCCRITDMLTFTGGILTIFLITFSSELIQYTFGSSYINSRTVLLILSIGVLGFTCAAANQLLQIKTNGTFSRNANIAAVFGLFAIAVPLVKLLGVEGAAISRVTIQICIGIATIYFARRLISINSVNWMNQVKIFTIVAACAIYNTKHYHEIQDRTIAAIICSTLIVFWIRGNNKELILIDLMNQIARLLPKFNKSMK